MAKVKRNLITAAVCVLIALLCLFGFMMFQNLCAEVFIYWGWETRQAVDLSANGFWYVFLTTVILAPVLEELIFRFLLCKGLKRLKLPDGWVIVIAAFLFMLYHWSWSQVAYQFIMGVFFAWIFLKTNNVLWTMLMHLINNAFIVTYTWLVRPPASAFALSAGNITWALVLAVATTVVVTFLIRKGIPDAKNV